ncbi:MAG: type I-C CRISPR-associated protein Cas5c [Candidatus Dormibacteraceae bacterium]
MTNPPLEVRVWGDFACFTRPEARGERVSYPIMTPTAARGVLEAIFWKPEFRWRVLEIWVLRPIKFFSILRNEVTKKAAVSEIRSWSHGDGFYVEEDRAQRHTLALRDVAYMIRADVEVREGVGENPAKYRDQLRRRVERGACAFTPYLGCREFSAFFGPRVPAEQPIDETAELGRMLLDIEYSETKPGHGTPRFFEARLDDGVMPVPTVP